MAEVLATMVVGPLVSMVKNKASSYLLDQYDVMEGMEEQHKLLKRKLPAVLDVVTDAEEQAANNREGAKAWLQELREVAYKANDVLDEFKYEALRRKAKAEGHYKEFGMDVIKLFPSHNRFVFRYRMANKLRMILQEIDVLIAEMNTFRFKFKPQPPMSMKWRQTDPNISDDSLKVIATKSRTKEKDEIVAKLCGQEENKGLTVLPIVGMGGMGKTTLAQLVYNDSAIEKHFQVRIWVCVSENFDVDSLFEIIVKEAEKNGCQMSGVSALEKFKSAVSGKRYLLVLDDVWNREDNKWRKLRSYLEHGGIGSSVVTTTRDKYIGQFMRTIKIHVIQDLDLNTIKEIIEIGAFGSHAKVPREFKELVGDIAHRCKGSPLAATALGSTLRTKSTEEEWKAILNQSKICDEENGILPILKLSYNCLPPHMRQCFSFCAMFPKDHKIHVEMLICLWMANGFIPEQQGVCPEVTGKQIFKELAQRSFFQEVRQDKFYRRNTCKIHDLMHDVAQDSMGKECAAVDTKLSQSKDFPYSARHLFLSVDIQENVFNGSTKKGSPAIHTLICDGSKIEDVQQLSKYLRPVRALKTRQASFLEPKYLHHLRYLDLSSSDIKALPEDITILYHLQTLNLSDCRRLEQLPKAMKYMTALRHLYTHRCDRLKSMPPNLGRLTSLQTLTCFVLGTGLGCSNVGELEKLDLGGQLELIQLENASETDAKAANLGNKKRLEELTLRWTRDHGKEADKKVLESLEPHDGLKAMRMYSYGGSAIATWMLKFQGMVELKLQNCKNLESLPALWQLPALQFLYLDSLENLHCLFRGGAPAKFQKLKRMVLEQMPKFETWWDTNEVQAGEEPLFPEVGYLEIRYCESLTALPKASVVKQSSAKGDIDQCRSMFPALREMVLGVLNKFHRWEAVNGTVGEDVTFPQLERLSIFYCPGLTTFPKAPKLSKLTLLGCGQQISLQAASRHINSLSSLSLKVSTHSNCNKEENPIEAMVRDHEFPLQDLHLVGCGIFFSDDSTALALWKCFGQLTNLEIRGCDALVYWPENLFRGLVSLRTLEIHECSKLTGHTKEEASDEQPAQQQGGPLPRLESLWITGCNSLVQVPNLSASLETLYISSCESLKSLVFGEQQEDTRLRMSGEAQPAETSSSSLLIAAGSSNNNAMLSTDKMSSSSARSNHCLYPFLEYLEIHVCGGLTEVANLPPYIKTLYISSCGTLVSLSGEVPSLERLSIYDCACLQSLPNGAHQPYSSLKVLRIKNCPGIKLLPPSLQQRLDHLDWKYLDGHLQGPVEPVPTTGRIAALMSKLECFRSTSQD